MSQSSVLGNGSVSSAADPFHLMFPDSDITAWFKTQNDDLVTYGPCPYLRLMTSLTEVPVTRGKWVSLFKYCSAYIASFFITLVVAAT